MSNPNDSPLTFPRPDARLPIPTAAPRGTPQPDIAGVPAQGPRPDVSMPSPLNDPAGSPGSRGYGPVPTILNGNAPVGATGRQDIPVWPAPSVAAATPRDPGVSTLMAGHAAGAQAMIEAYRGGFDPTYSTTDARGPDQGIKGNPFKDPRVISPVRAR